MKKLGLIALMAVGLAFTAEAQVYKSTGIGALIDGAGSGSANSVVRLTGFLNLSGGRSDGPHFGIELEGDMTIMDQSSSSFSRTSITGFYTNQGSIYFLTTNSYNETYTLFDMDVSPRLYLGFSSPDDTLEMAGFGGLSANFLNLQYELKDRGGYQSIRLKNGTYTSDYTDASYLPLRLSLVGGGRLRLFIFYVDYTVTFTDLVSSYLAGKNKTANRLGLGLVFPFLPGSS